MHINSHLESVYIASLWTSANLLNVCECVLFLRQIVEELANLKLESEDNEDPKFRDWDLDEDHMCHFRKVYVLEWGVGGAVVVLSAVYWCQMFRCQMYICVLSRILYNSLG